jgi:hypothetical protein
VLYVDDDDRQAIRRGIIDNAVARKSAWVDDVLKELLGEVGTDVPGLDDRDLAKLMKEVDGEKVEPVYPIVAKIGEEYSYVMVVATNDVDAAWLEERFAVRREKSYKSEKVTTSRVITVERLRNEWGES